MRGGSSSGCRRSTRGCDGRTRRLGAAHRTSTSSRCGGSSVEQNLGFALRVADYDYLLSKGRTVHECTPEALRADDAVTARYLGV